MKNHDAIFQYILVGALAAIVIALCIGGKNMTAAQLAIVSMAVGGIVALLKQNQTPTLVGKKAGIPDLKEIPPMPRKQEKETESLTEAPDAATQN